MQESNHAQRFQPTAGRYRPISIVTDNATRKWDNLIVTHLFDPGVMGAYNYAYNLAEPIAPQPFLTKWGVDVPFALKNNCQFWQPETLSNFETQMHANYLGLRLAWDPARKPAGPIGAVVGSSA